MMYRAVTAFAVIIAVAGCAFDAIDKGMTALQGQPLSAAVSKLGMPTEEKVIAGQKVYIWFTRTLDEGSEYNCQIRVIMKGDVIGSWDFEGNEGKCVRYADQLCGYGQFGRWSGSC
ncbi:MAG TPA: hypothetical protein VH678_04000 [Xanthobacteraceae bacterium]|jgi:hypothetical protein